MSTILRVLLSLVLFTVGLVLAAGLLLASTLLLAVWSGRALWLKLTGRHVPPFTARFTRHHAFRPASRKAPAGEVVDVEARHLP